MARDRLFGRVAGTSLVAANVLGLAIFLPVVGIPLSLVSVLVVCAWGLVAGVHLLRLGLRTEAAEPAPAVPATASA